MPWANAYKKWLVQRGSFQTAEGRSVKVWEFRPGDDADTLKSWAAHFRKHYCRDEQIDRLRNGTGKSRADYLTDIKFPHETAAPGPSIRAGDFAEILVADYVEYLLKYWVPRNRYADKAVRNESTKGCDILGFKASDDGKTSNGDELVIFEAKAQLTGGGPLERLQDAINDSAKDELRKAESLNAVKQKMLVEGEYSKRIALIERFQNFVDNPYRQRFGAAAIFSTSVYCQETIAKSTVANHPHPDKLMLIVIRGKELMQVTHELYRRDADEA